MSSIKPTHKACAIPIEDSADTVVILSNRRQFKFRSITLKQCSKLFAKLLEKDGPQLSKAAETVGIRYQLVLQNFDKQSGAEFIPVFRRVDLNSDGLPTQAVSIIREGDAGVNLKLFEHYERVFGGFFRLDIVLDKTNIATILEDALGLIGCAEYLGSVAKVATAIDDALISMGHPLYLAIASTPFEWIDLGYRLSSRVIYKEALVHLTGRYDRFKEVTAGPGSNNEHASPRTILESLNGPTRDLVKDKAAKLRLMCQQAEEKMMTYYPRDLNRNSLVNDDGDFTTYPSYSSDIFAWMALGYFRHFIGQAVAQNDTHQARDGGHTFYNCIHKGGAAYLDRETSIAFYARFSRSFKGKNIFTNHLNTIKTAAQGFVEPLFRNETKLNATDLEAVNWFVCTELGDEEYPWLAGPRLEYERRHSGLVFTPGRTGQSSDTDSDHDEDVGLDCDEEAAYRTARVAEPTEEPADPQPAVF